MSPLFIGSHPGTDFLNSAVAPNGNLIEFIGDGAAFVKWLVGAGLIERQVADEISRHFDAPMLDATAAQAREMREWARGWVAHWREAPTQAYAAEFARLNQWLVRASTYREVVADGEGAHVVERTRIDSPDRLLALLAMALALLITTEQAALVKPCAGPGCTLCFLDTTKGHRRLFCTASGCGNRAKVAAFRERQRTVLAA